MGSTYKGKHTGTLGRLGALSFNGNKTITSGGGGAVILSDETAERLIRHISTTARTADGYSHDEIGFNYRLTNVQAAIGVAQMEQLDSFLQKKRQIAKKYRTELEEFSGGQFPNVLTDTTSDWLSGIVLNDSHREKISEIISSLAKSRIQARESWAPIHEMKPYRSCLSSTMESMNFLKGRVLTLPNSTSLTSEDQEKVVQSVRRILTRL